MTNQSPASKSANAGGGSRLADGLTTRSAKEEYEKRKREKRRAGSGEYEFCKVCRINHNNGRSHNYFPRHAKSLSSFFAGFRRKMYDVRGLLKNPALHGGGGGGDRIWCVFCEEDVDELGSSFERANAIRHLASDDHLKNLKQFLWKYGGGKDKVDTFRITDEDLTKWEKKCTALKGQAVSTIKTPQESPYGLATDIQPNSQIVNNFVKYDGHFLESSPLNYVMPLQHNTNENSQVSCSDASGVRSFGSSTYVVASSAMQYGSSQQNSQYLVASGCGQHFFSYESSSSYSQRATISTTTVSGNQGLDYGTSDLQGLQNLTQISAFRSTEVKGNVHTGAPPPWFEATGAGMNEEIAFTIQKKSTKLNPKRVGAAWAERRKIEIEMEKRGEVTSSVSDANWLPNFGRVWQAGSRKESKKEFEKEKRKLPLVESSSEVSLKVQPYISKRMKGDTGNASL